MLPFVDSEVPYLINNSGRLSEKGSFDTDLNRLRATTDGSMDKVHSLRNTYRADIASLWLETGASCGLAKALAGIAVKPPASFWLGR